MDDQPAKKARTESTCPVSATERLGDTTVCCVGLGTLPAGVAYPAPALRPDAATFAKLVAAAAAAASPAQLFVDAADTYCEPYTDLHAIERALKSTVLPPAAPPLVITTKSGMLRVTSESGGWRPKPLTAFTGKEVRNSILAAQQACTGAAPLFLWSLHHTDTLTPPGALEEALEAAAACVAEGLVKHIGLCNATVPLLRRALAVTPILCVQNMYSPYEREAEKALPASAAASSKKGVLAFCAANNVAFVAYAPLGGLKARRQERDVGRDKKYNCFPELAAKMGCSPQALCLAALLHRGHSLGARMLVIPGARTEAHAVDSVTAARLQLTDEQVLYLLPPV